jgi:hypothetical protein
MHNYELTHSSGVKAKVELQKVGRKSHKMGEYADIFNTIVEVTEAPDNHDIWAVVRCFDKRPGYYEYHGNGAYNFIVDIWDYGWVSEYQRYMGQQRFHENSETKNGELIIGKPIAYEDEQDLNILFSTFDTAVPNRTGDQNVYKVMFALQVFTRLPDGTGMEIGNKVVSETKDITVDPAIIIDDPLDGLGGGM